jgi:phosphate transport system substrate-binding protein
MREVQNVPEGLFNYSSAPQFAALTSRGMNAAIIQAHPKFRLRYAEPYNNTPGSSTVIAMLISNLLSFGQTARPIEDIEYSKAKSHNFTLEQIPIGFDGIAFYTHRNLNIPGLSINQLQDIFMGKVTNWKQVGGPNLPIVPISLNPETNSSIKYLFANIKGAKLGSNVQIVRDYTEQTRKVAATPGAISYGSMATTAIQRSIRPFGLARGNSNQYVQPFTPNRQINATAIRDGSYPLTRRLFVVVRRDGLLDEQAGIAYANLLLSIEGQRIIDKAGFVSIRQ